MRNRFYRKLITVFVFALLMIGSGSAQTNVGIGTNNPHPSAKLDITSTTQGFLLSRMTTIQRDSVSAPAEGLMIFNTTTKCFEAFVNSAWYAISCAPAQQGCVAPVAPGAGNTVVSTTQIQWNWNTVSNATGYKYSTTNNYSSATDNGTSTNYVQACLNASSPYTLYVWAYDSCGVSPATTISVTTSSAVSACGGASTLTDSRDSKVYNIVSIGNQCWMAQNLNYGTQINSSSQQTVNQKYCYADQTTNCITYGGLYQWSTVMNGSTSCNGTDSLNPGCATPVQGICPTGWHVPSLYEWVTMERHVGIDPAAFPYNLTTNDWLGRDEGSNLKEAGTTHWNSPNTGATDCSGFDALGAGYNSYFGGYSTIGTNAWFTCATEYSNSYQFDFYVSNSQTKVGNSNCDKRWGISLRCVKD